MKASFLSTSLMLLCSLDGTAQGYINFSTRVSGTVVAHVYALRNYEFKSGNTASETPAGTQTYIGRMLTGSGFTAQLWYAVGAGQSESSLVLLAGSTTTFRTSAILGGTPAPKVLQVPGIRPGTGIGTFQIRVWNNFGGTITSWAAGMYRGKSALFEVTNLGDGILTLPADMVNVRSFGFYDPTFVPEPSGLALFSLGAIGIWFTRRGRRTARPGTQERNE